jgi:hypothetical protein
MPSRQPNHGLRRHALLKAAGAAGLCGLLSPRADERLWAAAELFRTSGARTARPPTTAVLLALAHAMQPSAAYLDAAADNLHYLLGRNSFGLSWVTQVGDRPFRNPHHRPSGADTNADPWPGLLSGGPNRYGGDPVIDAMPVMPPARRYRDDQASYASNEIAINWNAPLVFLVASQPPEGSATGAK